MKKVVSSERLPIKLWLDDLDDDALEQAKNLANLPFAYKWIAIMPDSHVGYGMPIGGVMATKNVIVPNAVGVDIGCGMVATKTNLTEISTPQLDEWRKLVLGYIPVGFNHQKADIHWAGFNDAPDLPVINRELSSARRQLGTLGGGNHFIELQKDQDGFVWLMIHSGSRNFGLKTAKEYHDKAKALCQKWLSDIPTLDLAFLPMGEKLGDEYLAAMNFALAFAQENRAVMMDWAKIALTEVVGGGVDYNEYANIHHNFAAMEHHYGSNVLVHRKGATKATNDTIGIIPGSMGSSSYIVQGLGNPESFESCSHGAGRTLGRGQAKRELNLEEEQAKMAGIVSGLTSVDNLDEAPGSYKDISQVMANQSDLVEILVELRPLANVKG